MRPPVLVCGFLVFSGLALAPAAAPPCAARQGTQAQTTTPPRGTSPDQPVFRGGIDLIQVDVSVLDSRGRPLTDLRAPEFTVAVDGKPRKVVSAEFISLRGPSAVERRAAVQSSEAAVSANTGQRRGRLVLIAVDRDSISFGGGRGAITAAARFLDKLTADDRVAFVAVPQPGPFVDFTSNHERVRAELERTVGLGRLPQAPTKNIGIQEALSLIRVHDPRQQEATLERFCGMFPVNSIPYLDCVADVRSEALAIVQQVEQQAFDSIRTLTSIFESLRDVEGPKSVVWISEGLIVDQSGSELAGLDRLAGAANATVHVVLLDRSLFDATQLDQSPTASRDRDLQVQGLELLAGYTRGALYRVSAGADFVFERLDEELSGYYLLGVESVPADGDGKRHGLKVSVSRQNASVRARREFQVPVRDARGAESPEESVVRALRSPFAATDLPLRLTTYAFRGEGASAVQVVVAAEIDGDDRTATSDLTVGYLLQDADGKVVFSDVRRAAPPSSPGAEGTVREQVALLTVEPGSYTLKLAAVDVNGRRGSLEHPLQAWQMAGVPFAVSDLILGDVPTKAGERLQPRVEARLAGDRLGAYMEVYAEDPATFGDLGVRLELAAEASAPALAAVAGALGPIDGGNRRTVSAAAPVGSLTPGHYVARVVLTRGDTKVWESMRPFYVTPAASAAALAAIVPDMLVKRPFQREDVLTPDVLGAAMDELQRRQPALAATLAPVRKGEFAGAARGAFEAGDQMAALFLRGLELYSAGDLNRAATQLNDALRLAPDLAPAALYFGACFAAGGRDREAVLSWRRASTGKGGAPIAYTLAADALARLGDIEQLVTMLTQAVAERPEDDGLRQRLAGAYAAAGRHKEAWTTVEPYLGRHPDDGDALFVALRAIYASRLEGQPVLGDAEAARRMAKYGQAYAQTRGPHAALVARWVEAMKEPPVR